MLKILLRSISLRTCCCADLKRAPQPHPSPVHSPCSERALWRLREERGAWWFVVCGVLSGYGYTLHVKPVGQWRRSCYKSKIETQLQTFGVSGNFKVQVLNRFWTSQTLYFTASWQPAALHGTHFLALLSKSSSSVSLASRGLTNLTRE